MISISSFQPPMKRMFLSRQLQTLIQKNNMVPTSGALSTRSTIMNVVWLRSIRTTTITKCWYTYCCCRSRTSMVIEQQQRRKVLEQIQQRLFHATASNNDNNNNTNNQPTTTTISISPDVATKKSLALSVYFYQPELGMKDYEILSRASAFLIAVDAKDEEEQQSSPSNNNNNNNNNPYQHLEIAEKYRKEMKYKFEHGQYTRPSGGTKRKIMDLNWLEFVPKEVRPIVHIVCSSHVVSPFLWKEYYPHDWLSIVKQRHIKYTLEVFEWKKKEDDNTEYCQSIAKIAIPSEPYHHPEGRDIALLHLKDDNEKSTIRLLKQLGIDILHLRNPDKMYTKGEEMFFHGYVVQEESSNNNNSKSNDEKYLINKTSVDDNNNNNDHKNNQGNTSTSSNNNDNNVDNRVFFPYSEPGILSFHSDDRFFATTPTPLPEGLCGAPVLDIDGECCGTVEGIVPINHANKKLAGSAAFIPSYYMKAFIDYVERGLIEQMMPKDLFQMVVTAKKTNSIGGGIFKTDDKGNPTQEEINWEEAYDIALNSLKKRYSPEEVDAIIQTVERERQEVLDIMDKEEDSDMNEVIGRVRQKTMLIREMVKDQYSKQQKQENTNDDNKNMNGDSNKNGTA